MINRMLVFFNNEESRLFVFALLSDIIRLRTTERQADIETICDTFKDVSFSLPNDEKNVYLCNDNITLLIT